MMFLVDVLEATEMKNRNVMPFIQKNSQKSHLKLFLG